MQQQAMNYRDLTIIYRGIYLPCQVNSQRIVSKYFEEQFRNEHTQAFSKKAQEANIASFKQLGKLKKFDVRLNSTKPQYTVKNSHLDFASYSKGKRLYFYVIDEQPLQNQNQSAANDYYIEFQLMNGGSIERSQSVNIKDMTYEELQSNLKYMFQIQATQQIQFINNQINAVIQLSKKQAPQKKLRFLKLKRLGVKRVYTAG